MTLHPKLFKFLLYCSDQVADSEKRCVKNVATEVATHNFSKLGWHFDPVKFGPAVKGCIDMAQTERPLKSQ